MFIENLLCTRHYCGHWRYGMEKDRFPVFMKLLIWWWEDNQTKISDIDKCCAEDDHYLCIYFCNPYRRTCLLI